MNTKKFLRKASLISFLLLNPLPPVFAMPQYMAPTGATSCDQCHLDNFGSGYRPGVLAASASPLGKFPGLIAFLNPKPPAPVGANTKPVLHPIDSQWHITVNETPLNIPLRISDAEDDNVVIKGSVPFGASVSVPTTDPQSHLPIAFLTWKPTATQAGKSYTLTLTANEIGTGRNLVSNALTTTVTVWPARNNALKNVSQLIIQRAQWSNEQLLLAGQVIFNSNVTAAQRSNLLASLKVNLTSKNGLVIDSPQTLSADSNGNWTKSIALNASQVPCVAKINYDGLIATRTVKLAPLETCLP